MVWLYIIIAIVLILGVSYLITPDGRNFCSMFVINRTLRKLAKKFEGVGIRDLLLEENHATSQIDYLLLTKKALYVIEATNLNGIISGKEDGINWTKKTKHFFKRHNVKGKAFSKTNTTKQQFHNPIKINRTNIHKIINLIIESVHVPVFNIVVFGNKAELTDVTHLSKYHVINRKDLFSTIFKLETEIEKEYEVLSQVDFYDSLLYINITDKNYRRKYVSNAKKNNRK